MLDNLNRLARPLALVVLFATPLIFPSPISAAGEKEKTRPATTPAAKVATTPEEHLAKAAEYLKKSAAYRAEADVHRNMLDKYVQENNNAERPDEDPYVTKMRTHCESFISKADALATEAEKFADFHRMWAAQLRGK